jgi:hypothetical protein
MTKTPSLSGPKATTDDKITVDYYSNKLKIRDFDAALGYIFSVCPLPREATSEAILPSTPWQYTASSCR